MVRSINQTLQDTKNFIICKDFKFIIIHESISRKERKEYKYECRQKRERLKVKFAKQVAKQIRRILKIKKLAIRI